MLALFSVFSFVNLSNVSKEIAELRQSVNDKTNKVIIYKGEDAYTPVKNVDYFDGNNGTNAVSYSIQTTVLKEVPIIGPKGQSAYEIAIDNGFKGTEQDWLLSLRSQDTEYGFDSNGNWQSRKVGEPFWYTLITCDKFVNGCKE